MVSLAPLCAVLLASFLLGALPTGAQQTVGYVKKLEGELQPLMAQAGPDPAALALLRGALSRVTEAATSLKDGLDALGRQASNSQASAGVPANTSPSALAELLQEAESQYDWNVKVREPWIKGYHREKNLPRLVTEILMIPTYPCVLETRLGDWRDGGKWVCLKHNHLSPKIVALSIGSKGEKSFEEELSTRLGGFSYVFDPSLKQPVQDKMNTYPYLKFYNMGLAGEADVEKVSKHFPDGEIKTLEGVIQATGQTYFDIFKIDCEGCEVEVAKDMAKLYTKETVPFGQVQMELHHADRQLPYYELLTTLESLGFRLFHSETNPFFKDHYEVAYIHEKLVKPVPV